MNGWGQLFMGDLAMGRRADHQRDELSLLAMDAGERIVADKGMYGLTVRALMGDIGYSAGTFYNLFSNLDDFLLRLAGRTLEKILATSRASPPTGDAAQDLKSLAALYLDHTRTHANLWRMVMEHRLPKGMSHPRWYRVLVIKVLAEVEAAIKPVQLEKSDERQCALTLWASMQGICAVTMPGAMTQAPKELALALSYQLVDFYVAGLKVKSK